MIEVSDINGVKPYFITADGLTAPKGRFEGRGIGFAAGRGTGAGAPGADGICLGTADVVAVGAGECCEVRDDSMIAEIDAPAAADPAAIKASVVFDMSKGQSVVKDLVAR